MGRKRPERTERRSRERAARQLVRDREKLAALSPGGAEAFPIVIASASVVDVRVNAMPCPQCEGQYQLIDHAAPSARLRKVTVKCRLCGVSRVLWFRIAPEADPN